MLIIARAAGGGGGRQSKSEQTKAGNNNNPNFLQDMQEDNVVVQSASLVQSLETRVGCVRRVRCRPALPLIKYEIDSKSVRLK